MRILVVDDKDIHRQSAYETLSGHEITVVSSFDEAMEHLRDKEKYDAVLSDMRMPMSRKTLSEAAYRRGELVDYGFVVALRAALCGAKYIAVVTDVNHHQGAMSAALDYIEAPHYKGTLYPNFIINGATCMFVHAPFVRIMHKETCPQCDDASGICRFCHGTGIRDDKSCNACEDNLGKCYRCKGTGKADKIEYTDRKDWGHVLKDLIAPKIPNDEIPAYTE